MALVSADHQQLNAVMSKAGRVDVRQSKLVEFVVF